MESPFFSLPLLVRTAPSRRIRCVLLLFSAWLGFLTSAQAQYIDSNNDAIWNMYYGNENYAFVSQSTDSNGNYALQYQADDGSGSTSTLTWNSSANVLINVVFQPSFGASVTYAPAGSSFPPGSLTMTGSGLNALQSLNAATYSNYDTIAIPENETGGVPTFGYGTATYTQSTGWRDMFGTDRYYYADGSGGTAEADFVYEYNLASVQLTTSNGAFIHYTSSGQPPLSYAMTADSNGSNLLSSLGTIPVISSTTGFTMSSPRSVQFAGYGFSPEVVAFGYGTNPADGMYSYSSNVGGNSQIYWDGTTISQISMFVDDGQSNPSGNYVDGTSLGRPGAFYINYQEPDNPGTLLTQIGSTQYIRDGDFVVPAPAQVPVATISNFQYQGEDFSQTGTPTWSGGYAVYQYQGSNGDAATVQWEPNSKTLGALTITSPGGGAIATYTDGTASGNPGSYMLTSGSNALTWVNNVAYTANGNLSSPPSNITDQGNLILQGNQLDLGVWTGDSSQVGLILSYQDGYDDPTGANNVDAAIQMSSSRTRTDWYWEHPVTDYSTTMMGMQLDATNTLQLFPAQQTTPTAPVAASVKLNPNGESRFDGPVRIAPQGDLLMGTFTNEPAQ